MSEDVRIATGEKVFSPSGRLRGTIAGFQSGFYRVRLSDGSLAWVGRGRMEQANPAARREAYVTLPITLTRPSLSRLENGSAAYASFDPTFPRATREGWLEGAIDVEYGMQDASYVREVIQAASQEDADA